MDMRTLTCFIAVAEELHFRRAAYRLGLTQPALSQRIRALEDEVGTALLQRDRRHVLLTPAGAAFLDPARASVANARLAKVQALRAARGEVGHLRLGFTVIAFYGLLPSAVDRMRRLHPDVRVELTELNSPMLEAALTAGDIDLAVLHPPVAAKGLGTRRLPDQHLILALPHEHPLVGENPIALGMLEGEPFLIAPRAIGPGIYDRVIAYFRAQGFSPNIVQEITPMTTLTGLVSAGVGMGFVTDGIATLTRPGVVFRPVEPRPPSLPMAAAWREPGPSAAADRFLDIVATLLPAEPGIDG